MSSDLVLLIPIFFLIALFYSSVGFGGGSSYLAILALFSLNFVDIRIIALLCNITVVSGSVLLYYKSGYLNTSRILPLILFSIPLAYLGGRLGLDESVYFILLGFALLFAALLLMIQPTIDKVQKLPNLSNGIIGGGVGYLSGLVGIGGGIFLSPVLHLTRWGKSKDIAATTALFILVNSLAGLIGQLTSNKINVEIPFLLALIISVFIGGQIGSRITIIILKDKAIKKMTGLLIFIVAIRILYKYLFV